MGHVVYCLLCLGTGIKMYQMNSAMITKYNELMLRRYKMTLSHMYACYECAYLLNKYGEFQAKCCRAFNLLRKLSHGSYEVTEENLKQIDRKQNKLEPLLSITFTETDSYQPKENCSDPQIIHNKIKSESSVAITEELCYENIIEEQEELKLPINDITSMCKHDQSENAETYTEFKSNIETDIEEDNNYQCIDVANDESFGDNSNEECLVEIPNEDLDMCEKKADNIDPIKLDIENLDSNCESVSFELPEILSTKSNCESVSFEIPEILNTKSNCESVSFELPEIINTKSNCESVSFDLPELLNTNSSDGNKIGTRKRKCVMQGDNKILNNKSIKKTNKNNDVVVSLECVSNKDVKTVMKKKTQRTRSLKVPAKKKERNSLLNSNLFKDHVTIIKLSPEDARCELLLRKESTNFKMTSHKCDLCYRGFISEATYQAHMKKHSSEYGTMKCDICQLNFSDSKLLKKHYAICHSWKLFCKSCSYMCFNVKQAQTHVQSHIGKKYICKVCGESFRFPSAMSLHNRKKHNVEVACDLCGSMFASELGLRCHKSLSHKKEKNEHLGPQCDECDVHFASELAWKRHLVLCSRHEVHNGCRVCGETLSTQEELKSHAQEHGQRNTMIYSHVKDWVKIPCRLCKKEVNSRRAYIKHMKTEHPETNINDELMSRCICEVCGKAFQQMSQLILHQRKHTDEKPFSCPQCSKKFKNEYSLKMHLPVHTNEYSFKCHLCEKAFGDRGRLNVHVKRHLGIRPYKCSYCDKSFPFQCEERLHTKYVHCKEPYPKRDRRKKSVKKENIK